MPIIKIDVDTQTYGRLLDQAVAERRPIAWQAEVTLRRALGLPFPPSPEVDALVEPPQLPSDEEVP